MVGYGYSLFGGILRRHCRYDDWTSLGLVETEGNRPEKAAAKARAEAYAEAGAMYREKLLRAGIDPDTGERLPHFNNGTGATNGQT